jgi:hypothetical protein
MPWPIQQPPLLSVCHRHSSTSCPTFTNLLITTRQTATFSGKCGVAPQQTSTQKPRRAREPGYGARADGRARDIPPSELATVGVAVG